MVPFPELLRTLLTAVSRKRLADLQKISGEIVEYGSTQLYRQSSEDNLTQRFVEARMRAAADSSAQGKEKYRKRYFEISLLAKVCEAARRSVGMTPFPCQLAGTLALNRGLIVQMETGEGKTLSAAMSAICNAHLGKRTVIVTANEYLARRDAEWMGPLYKRCGVRVAGVSQSYDLKGKYSQYEQEVIYIANSTLIFDYLRARSAISAWDDLPLGREVAIIDEIDNVLIDQANQSFTITNNQTFDPEPFHRSQALVGDFEAKEDFEIELKSQRVDFTAKGRAKVKFLATSLRCHPVEALFYLQAALRARYFFKRNRDYLVDESGIVIIDDISGRPIPGRKWAFGLQQAIEAKEHTELSQPGRSTQSAGVSSLYKNLFSEFSGLSGSAVHNAVELVMEYRKELVIIPPNVQCKRVDLVDLVYRTRPERNNKAAREAVSAASRGRPVLIGVTSIEEAYEAADAVQSAGGSYELLTARNVHQEAGIISQAGVSGRITIADRLAGRGVDIKLDEQARKAGGLHVIALGRSVDRRLDDQLRGRSGRQGDPGSSQFVVSLQDELMQVFGGPFIQKFMLKIGMEEDVAIDSQLISRRIRAAQYSAVLARYRQRQDSGYLDAAIFNAQRDLFQYRQRVLQAYRLTDLWTELLQRIESRMRAQPETIAPAVSLWKLLLPEDLTLMVGRDPRNSIDEVMKFLREACGRSLEIYREAEWNANVKFIILRAVDSSWENFLDEVRRGAEGLTMFSSAHTTFERLSSLGRILQAGRENAWAKADNSAVENLLCRGSGSFEAALSARDVAEMLSDGDPKETLFSKSQAEMDAYCWKLAFESPTSAAGATLADHARGYLEFLITREGKNARLARTLDTIKDFERFLDRGRSVDEFQAASKDFLARKRSAPGKMNVRSLFDSIKAISHRQFERSLLWEFGEHLQLQGLIHLNASQVVGWKEVTVTSQEVLRRMALPVLWLKLGYIVLFAFLFRAISLLSFQKTPALALAITSRLGFTSGILPATIDKLLLGGALTSHGLGMLGLIPGLLAVWVMTLITRRHVYVVHWMLSLPMAVLLLALLTPWQELFAEGKGLAWPATLGAVLVGTTLISILAGIAPLVEVLDAVMLTVLVNSWFVTLAYITHQPAGPALVAFRVAGFAAILGAYWLASRTGQTKFQVEHAEVEVEGNVEIEVAQDVLGIDIGSDGSQYWNALLFGGFVDAVARSTGLSPVTSAGMAFATYLLSLLVLQQWRTKHEFSIEAVMNFLDSRNSRMPDADDGVEKLSKELGHGVQKLFGLDVVMCGAIALFAYTANIGSLAILPFVIGTTMLWGVLTNRLLRQMRSAMAGNTLAQAIRVPFFAETADEDKPLWRKATDFVLRLQTNHPVGAILVIYAIFQMLQTIYHGIVHTAKR